MKLTSKWLTAGGLAVASALLAPTASAQWGGPWGGGPWGGPWGPSGWGPNAPRTVTREDWDFFYNPYGPSWTDIRRRERRQAWQGVGIPPDVPSPLGPSATELRRIERQTFYRSLGLPY